MKAFDGFKQGNSISAMMHEVEKEDTTEVKRGASAFQMMVKALDDQRNRQAANQRNQNNMVWPMGTYNNGRKS